MPKSKLLGWILLACGAWLLWQGQMVADRTDGTWFSQVMTGTVSDQALLYWVAGIVLGIAGVMMVRRR